MDLPANIEVEQALLGALIHDRAGQCLPLLSGLKPDHFSEPVHSRIFEAIQKLNAKGNFGGALALKSYFTADATLAEIGGPVYLANLAANAAAPISLKSHANLLREMSARRQAVEAADKLIQKASTVNVNEAFRPALAEHIGTMQGLDNGKCLPNRLLWQPIGIDDLDDQELDDVIEDIKICLAARESELMD